MVNVQRHRMYDPRPILVPVDLANQIEIGDLCYLEVDDARAASAATQTSQNGTQDYIHDRFLGVALSGHKANDANVSQVRIGTEGEYDYPAAAGTYRIGTLITAAADTGNAVLSQKLEVSNQGTPEAEGLGYCARNYGVNPATIRVRIKSVLMGGGVQVKA